MDNPTWVPPWLGVFQALGGNVLFNNTLYGSSEAGSALPPAAPELPPNSAQSAQTGQDVSFEPT
jgi:hypothetical protein